MAQIIDGKTISQQVRQEVKEGVAQWVKGGGVIPGLATVLVGDDPASQVYVKNKNKATVEAGMHSRHIPLPVTTSESQLLELIDNLNRDSSIHGILVQLPLPSQIKSSKILEAIDPKKDVDGFHPINVGRLVSGDATLMPCTPLGVMRLIKETGMDLRGKNAVIVGRSNIVGKPMALLLLQANATVTICHSHTKDLQQKVKEADVVVAAIGKPNFVKGDWIKTGAVIIDVGINRLPNGKLVGDVDFEAASREAAWITPVPGGVGPVTIAMLLNNTLLATKNISH
ncbi:MAG: bifunctional methylenetetrahydrofolate dehydrogenase/methenyltetrahydrofolate cyclohydrolase [Deltaproteobacteria bacterium RIFCSPLOWO2_12_FULL_40_28]|nr:MAG: bifunctional methylenetetrahydrofolate dehydrogenase/methenyltetrahydrofolate cyclohydrolase [Deltaproteobacteria bacterium RIFCSPHIGHO2_02_FULL_40_28]OGQ20023.1 MAG: bifunctional methylenetetrahydrofolate dehydrogenase/methenyltetrahydrofolate cyclohydrolase [Deltaproteobacteria bacterium RIFCSPHIGHO2_12_FULL_40_32]OGQ40590.1 MAG: bifunctional methylenetetrahydrofolate dehydrogenase/methenyltetrahydrofolate cyclohydrolase [Deltaproteobacteria bacterium RIFCSPLOWO2_02_FULL_40_36]OGQ54259